MKNSYIKIAFAFIGVIVGAGLSSGQDILQYFLCFGSSGLIGVMLLGLLNIVFGRIMVTLGCYYRSDNHEAVFSEISHPVVTRMLDLVLAVGGFCMGFVMVAGAGANMQQQFGIPFFVGALFCTLLIIFISFLDFEKITGILGGFTPVMIGMILLIAAYTFFGKSYDFQELDQVARTIKPAMGNLWLSVIDYYALCAMTGVSMAFILGGSVVRIGVAEKGGTIGGMLIGIIVMVAALSLYANIREIKDADMPMLAIVNSIHPFLASIYALTIFALIFNTAFSLYYSIARRYSGGDVRKMRRIMIMIASAGFLCSFGGFRQLIGIMYPVLGYMGILLLVILFCGYIRERKNIVFEKFLRRKMIRISLKKQDPDRKFNKKEEALFHRFGEISQADAGNLKRDIHEMASRIVENVDDTRAYAEEHFPVDDEKFRAELTGQQRNQAAEE
ncbi:MAG: hypothetical protein LIV11_03760 [Bacillota bacterium]|nr:hypothetical protein [Bacillota bacterium]